MFYLIIILLSSNCLIAFPTFTKTDPRINVMIDLMKNCFPETSNFLISDSSDNSIYTNFYNNILGSVTLHDHSINYKKDQKVPCVIMILSSPLKIKQVFFNETWRDFNQFFIILEENDSECKNAQSFLMEAWKNDILNVVFLCFDQVFKIYSFNPFTEFAPSTWKKISSVPGIEDHPWTLFNQIYDPSKCTDFFFDKTKDLGGYLIKVGAMKLVPFLSYKYIEGVPVFEGYDYEVLKLVLEKLNATLNYTITSVIDEIHNTKTGGVFWTITRGEVDLQMTSLIARGTSHKAELTYPNFESKISVISQQRKYNTVGGSLFTFLPSSIAALFFFTSTIIFILLRIVFKDPYSKHILDILRVFLNLAVPTLPFTSRGRIVFGVTLVSFTIANIVIQANMNTVLTSKNAARNVQSLKDLKELKYNVFAPPFIKPVLINEDIKKLKIVAKSFHCSELKNNEAFIGKTYILRTLMTRTCHMPKKPLVSGMYNAYYTRRNWPIFPKITKQLLILFQTGITDYHIERILRDYETSKPQDPEQYQVISMDHMKFSFYVFASLCLLSSIVFFVELIFVLFCSMFNC